MARLSGPDTARWHALAGRVAAVVERSLSPRVVANRAVGGGRGWSLEPVGPALRRTRSLARAAFGSSPLLRTDVAAFYPSVTAPVAFSSLRRVGADPGDAMEAADLLEGWGNEGYPGLPVGPPASAVLANAVLASVDDVLAARRFVRWVDDYLIPVPSERAASEVTERLDDALDRLGLNRSEPKTRVTEGGVVWAGTTLPSPGGAEPPAPARIAAP
jgi:hypothetical protein